ncbi:MAG: hypothetical protein H0U90_03860 [Actinobacteria bacterium]|nr:hypothetical protein [Actinomycetota bacterium]
MSGSPDSDTTYEVVCPHCNKSFAAEPMTGAAPRYQGFKCPHCRLFVAYDRIEEPTEAEATG